MDWAKAVMIGKKSGMFKGAERVQSENHAKVPCEKLCGCQGSWVVISESPAIPRERSL
jgi:hypothetical protein